MEKHMKISGLNYKRSTMTDSDVEELRKEAVEYNRREYERYLNLRLRLGETQVEFAERIGVRSSSISDWETGKKSPSRLARKNLEKVKK